MADGSTTSIAISGGRRRFQPEAVSRPRRIRSMAGAGVPQFQGRDIPSPASDPGDDLHALDRRLPEPPDRRRRIWSRFLAGDGRFGDWLHRRVRPSARRRQRRAASDGSSTRIVPASPAQIIR